MPGFRLAPGADAQAVADALSGFECDLGATEPDIADRALLVAGEIAGNAAEHGTTRIAVSWIVASTHVTLTVEGRGPDAARILTARLPENSATRGRGLYLIQTLASRVEDTAAGLRIRID